jgi:hypothetical protein
LPSRHVNRLARQLSEALPVGLIEYIEVEDSSLRSKTVARGCTPAEARAAAAKVAELTYAEKVVEAEAILVKLSWSEQQARGMVAALSHLPPWRGPASWRWSLLHDWASAHQHKDPTTLNTQLQFMTHDLRSPVSDCF